MRVCYCYGSKYVPVLAACGTRFSPVAYSPGQEGNNHLLILLVTRGTGSVPHQEEKNHGCLIPRRVDKLFNNGYETPPHTEL